LEPPLSGNDCGRKIGINKGLETIRVSSLFYFLPDTMKIPVVTKF
jgi:hypothetical protein